MLVVIIVALIKVLPSTNSLIEKNMIKKFRFVRLNLLYHLPPFPPSSLPSSLPPSTHASRRFRYCDPMHTWGIHRLRVWARTTHPCRLPLYLPPPWVRENSDHTVRSMARGTSRRHKTYTFLIKFIWCAFYRFTQPLLTQDTRLHFSLSIHWEWFDWLFNWKISVKCRTKAEIMNGDGGVRGGQSNVRKSFMRCASEAPWWLGLDLMLHYS